MHTLYSLNVTGLVQGVGFRPYVEELGNKLNLKGSVSNIGGQVLIKIFDDKKGLDILKENLSKLCKNNTVLPGSRVDNILISTETSNENPPRNFFINNSLNIHDNIRFIPVDYATCDKCKSELLDKNNRRYRYPFISCVACGPRITIINELPYDRENTSMKDFPMCEACETEYKTFENIRHYAQTIACHDCGPILKFYAKKRNEINGLVEDYKLEREDAFSKAVKEIKAGKVLAVKDIGGYHFVCDAKNVKAIRKMRQVKAREKKAFAVMFPDVKTIKKLAYVSEKEAELLESNARPIVLLRKREEVGSDTDNFGYNLSEEIDDNAIRIGAMLPSNPLQILLMQEFDCLIMTSGNLAGEPIITRDKDIFDLVKNGQIDGSLYNEREIVNPLDDSILKVTKLENREITQIIRRARGYVPDPIKIDKYLNNDSYAAGADLKSVFALARKNYVTLSGHFGDLNDYEARRTKDRARKIFTKLLDLKPKSFIADRHPGYYSNKDTKILANEAGTKALEIQHHHAHQASVMAEHSLSECIGIVLDGTGYGNDGNIWGGEFLYCKDTDFRRLGHFDYLELIGADNATVDIDKSAMVAMIQAINAKLVDEELLINHPCFKKYINSASLDLLKAALKEHINSYKTSSVGRLFDIAAVIMNICQKNSYEGEAPMKLEALATRYFERIENLNPAIIPVIVKEINGEILVDSKGFMSDLFKLYIAGARVDELAFEFHNSLAKALVSVAIAMRDKTNCSDIALSGGCFNNSLLLKLLVTRLEKEDFKVYLNEKVPCGDGGIALGQIYLGN